MTAAVWAIRSTTFGTPSTLIPPPGFGISTIRTGPGKYDPDDIRFHSLYRPARRSASNCVIDTPSGPAAPPLLLTFSHASHTRRFGISCDLPCNPGSGTRFIPFWLATSHHPDDPSPWLHPRYQASQLLRDSPPAFPVLIVAEIADVGVVV